MHVDCCYACCCVMHIMRVAVRADIRAAMLPVTLHNILECLTTEQSGVNTCWSLREEQ